ncbi:MAG: histidine phosphatase family protein [Cyclobacteriaceae bacterium]|nr:histidine phosphatase family protein [Cytophagales bacterium]MBX2898204.1 histidine phosphatase family protein [Cyclobacteriaceae bacterium]
MKKLYIVRHAKSSWDEPELDDFDRPLNTRGIKDAPRMGKRLKEKHVTPDIMLSSPAERALATCKAIAAVLQFDSTKIKTDKRLYHADEDQLLEVVRGLKDSPRDSEEVAFIFGHNPGLTAFANLLVNQTIDNIPTCGIVAALLPVNHWQEVAFGSGKLLFFDFPKRADA